MSPDGSGLGPQLSGSSLEDRLRGMILNNSVSDSSATTDNRKGQRPQKLPSPSQGPPRYQGQSDWRSKGPSPYAFPDNSQSTSRPKERIINTDPVEHNRNGTAKSQGARTAQSIQGDRQSSKPSRNLPKRPNGPMPARDVDSFINPPNGRNPPPSSQRGEVHSLGAMQYVQHSRQSSRPTTAQISDQIQKLENAAHGQFVSASMPIEEIQKRRRLREELEKICCKAILKHEMSVGNMHVNSQNVTLELFGSVGSGFATRSSDMDLAVVSINSLPPTSSRESPIPRLLEKALLESGYGARLLTRTRVPIIRFCELPGQKLKEALLKARTDWEAEIPLASKPRNGGPKFEKDDGVQNQVLNGPDGPQSPASHEPLKQRAHETTFTYARRAKRLLENSGQVDYHVSKPDHHTAEERAKLVDFVEKFVQGLSNNELKIRLSTYQSLDFDLAREKDHIVSLYQCGLQAEGEELAMLVNARNCQEVTMRAEQQLQELVAEWTLLQKRRNLPLKDYLFRIRHAFDKLKASPTIAIANFYQLRNEKVDQYCSRAAVLLKRATGQEPNSPPTPDQVTIFTDLVRRFIGGISKAQVQSALSEFETKQTITELNVLLAQFREESRLHRYLKTSSKQSWTDDEMKIVNSYAAAIRKYGVLSTEKWVADSRAAYAKFELGQSPDDPPAERAPAPLDYPKEGVGIQCDINFSNYLALENTVMLRCYSLCDTRVTPMVIFVKTWAKNRGINSPYHATLSSYGYVLMVLHFLANVANPPVIPNLQAMAAAGGFRPLVFDGYSVNFFRDEEAIRSMASNRILLPQHNFDSIGQLLRTFFHYFAKQNYDTPLGGFSWFADVLSLRSPGGLLTKQSKGWIGAKTTVAEITGQDSGREIRHRYLMAIEDPFEIDHNIARTVAHDGICKIRDEFRRAWQLISEKDGEGISTLCDVKLG
ncbi:MAG: hypothetical protein M1814_005984 [Vezdaea aestivalis]|nr:MAG: hypothetical protein M1814_005984 [Vezdaea aestivalis]